MNRTDRLQLLETLICHNNGHDTDSLINEAEKLVAFVDRGENPLARMGVSEIIALAAGGGQAQEVFDEMWRQGWRQTGHSPADPDGNAPPTEAPALIFEQGKRYVTAGGQVTSALDDHGVDAEPYRFYGRVDGQWRCWMSSGRYYERGVSDLDLVREWDGVDVAPATPAIEPKTDPEKGDEPKMPLGSMRDVEF